MGLSKTPTAEIERTLYGASVSSVSQVMYTREGKEPEEEEMYSAENFRRIARSLSGTVITNREETMVSSHSFEAPNTRKMPMETSHRSSSSTSFPFPHDPPVFPYDSQHNPNQMQHLPHDVLMPSMVGKARKPSGDQKNIIQKLLVVPDRGEAFQGEDYPGGGVAGVPGGWRSASGAARHTATLPEKRAALGAGRPGQPARRLQEGLESYAAGCRLPPGTDYSTLRTPREPSWDPQGCPVPPSYAKAPGPRRVDMPPDEDWRQSSYTPQPGRR
ncbi:UBP54 hydrolase, partial [Nothoprocta ornata]|nr:UBP54 hydrolase [Nothoprocta ornata]